MKVVAQFLSRDQAHLRVVFPDLCDKIKSRYIDYQKTVRSQRRLQFLAQVRKVVIELCEQGINPSRKHVVSAIENPSIKAPRLVQPYIAQVLREMETENVLGPAK
jgi:hypothetical protein